MTETRTLSTAEIDAVGGAFSCYYPLPPQPFEPFGPTIFWPYPNDWERVDNAG